MFLTLPLEDNISFLLGGDFMYRIGLFSKINKVTIKALRYYDEIGLVVPKFIDNNGYRYYTSDQLSTIHQVIALKQLGLSISEIQAIISGANIT
jgi:DNA-binding transcriptional MerR regulator